MSVICVGFSHRRYTRLMSLSITLSKSASDGTGKQKTGRASIGSRQKRTFWLGGMLPSVVLASGEEGLLICLGTEHLLLQGTCGGGRQRAPEVKIHSCGHEGSYFLLFMR